MTNKKEKLPEKIMAIILEIDKNIGNLNKDLAAQQQRMRDMFQVVDATMNTNLVGGEHQLTPEGYVIPVPKNPAPDVPKDDLPGDDGYYQER